jgi:flagellar basal-body rod protein FlgF
MPKGIYAAASAMVTETRLLEATARNIANAQTPGYRREGLLRVGFAEVLAGEGRQGGLKGDGGAGVLPDRGYRVFTDGPRDPTGHPFDLALSGDGFFTVQGPDGRLRLTRDGHFRIDQQGRLAARDGGFLMGQGGPVTIPEGVTGVVIDEAGSVSTETTGPEGVVRAVIDRVRVASVADPRRLAEVPGGFDPAGQALADAPAVVHQGHLERANVNPVDELVTMVALQRRYDAAQKAISEQSRAGEGYSDILRG